MKKFSEYATVVLFCGIILTLSVLFLALPDQAFSQQENRTLATAPSLNADSFFSGQFASDLNIYIADQFPFRNSFLQVRSFFELMLGKGENNGVLYSYDQLAVKEFDAYKSRMEITEDTDQIYLDTVKAQLEVLNRFSASLEIPMVTVLPGRTIDVCESAFAYERPDGDGVFEAMNALLDENAGYIDTLSLLRDLYDGGEYVMYKTDHHWTTLGAYYVYCEIMKELGKEDRIVAPDRFEKELIADFSGTTAAKGNFPVYARDSLELWHLPDDGEYTVTVDGEPLDGFYERSYLDVADKYSVFLDGTHNVTEIRKSGEERETLLIAKDSFANCLIPFLAREYDIVALNLRTNTALSAAVETYSADALLIVYNVENIITSADLGNLK